MISVSGPGVEPVVIGTILANPAAGASQPEARDGRRSRAEDAGRPGALPAPSRSAQTRENVISTTNVNPSPPTPGSLTAVHGPPGPRADDREQCRPAPAGSRRAVRQPTRAVAEASATVGDDGEVLIVVRGEIDLANAGALRQRLHELAGPAPRHVRLDLSGVDFIDCSGLRVLSELAQQVLAAGGTMCFGEISQPAARLFELAGWPHEAATGGVDHTSPGRAGQQRRNETCPSSPAHPDAKATWSSSMSPTKSTTPSPNGSGTRRRDG